MFNRIYHVLCLTASKITLNKVLILEQGIFDSNKEPLSIYCLTTTAAIKSINATKNIKSLTVNAELAFATYYNRYRGWLKFKYFYGLSVYLYNDTTWLLQFYKNWKRQTYILQKSIFFMPLCDFIKHIYT